MKTVRLGFRYCDGKVLIYKSEGNPGKLQPAWAVDIREILAMVFVGLAALLLISCGEYEKAQVLLVGLLAYATGRTVPGGFRTEKEEED